MSFTFRVEQGPLKSSIVKLWRHLPRNVLFYSPATVGGPPSKCIPKCGVNPAHLVGSGHRVKSERLITLENHRKTDTRITLGTRLQPENERMREFALRRKLR